MGDSNSNFFNKLVELGTIRRKTITGKLKILIVTALLILTGFSCFVYLQVESIKDDYYKLEKYNFAFQNVFIFQAVLGGNQMEAVNKVHSRDTTLINFSTQSTLKLIDTVTYSLSLADTTNYNLTPLKDVFTDYQKLVRGVGQELINNKYTQNESRAIDSTLAIKVTNNECIGKFYGTLYGSFFQKLGESKNKTNEKLLVQTSRLRGVLIFIAFLLSVSLIFIGLYIIRSLKRSLNRPKIMLEELSLGKLPETLEDSKDELSYIIKESNNLTNNLRAASSFALEIGKANFNHTYQPSSKDDTLGNALVKMSEDLKAYHEKEKQQNWAINGQAQFAEIIRNSHHNLIETCNIIISKLVKYLDANQGGLFFFNQETQQLDLLACYAYNRKKYHTKHIHIGEGLVGQCYLEGERIYMNDLPEEYINITSGLGTSNPRAIIIIPMRYNDKVEGVIEIATFKDFLPYQIDFVEKLGEMLGATISNIKHNEFTEKLLKESRLQSQSLSQQEEELRQNLEELHATQEEVMRREQTYLEEIRLLKSQLEMKSV